MTLIGFVDGAQISFEFHPPDTYIACLPSTIKGSYIVELKAQDEAGNIAVKPVDKYVLVNFDQLEFKVLENLFEPVDNSEKYTYVEVQTNYDCEVVS